MARGHDVARDLKAIHAALVDYLPDGGRITGISPITAGNSNETFLIEGLDLILRLPPSETSLLEPNGAYGVAGQYRILDELGSRELAPAVAKVVLLEEDPGVLGDPFFLMERIVGEPWPEWSAPDWLIAADETVRSSVSEQLVTMYARLHNQVPLVALGRPFSVREEVERWRAPLADLTDPILRRAFDLLVESAPPDERPVPCHGDSKHANTLWRDGTLVGMVDFEMSFNGDPRWDLANIVNAYGGPDYPPLRGMDSPGLWRREQIIQKWCEWTGRTADALEWFESGCRARYAAITTYGVWLLKEGKTTDERFATYDTAIGRLSKAALDLAERHIARG
jgi:aminoglycoside phosphotransferase (APT) family kinase protein